MRIAMFLPNWVGDVVMATPAINALWESFLGVSLIAVGRPYIEGVIEGSPWFDRFISTDANKWYETSRALRHQRCDVAILFPNSFRSALTAWSAHIPRRIGFDRYHRRRLLTDPLEPARDEQGQIVPSPIIDAYNRLVAHLGVIVNRRIRLFTMADDEKAAGHVWGRFSLERFSEVVALNPGAAFGSAKCWPVEYFAKLAQQLTTQRGAGVVVLCGPAERELARKIVDQSNHPNVFSIADEKLSLGLTKAIIRRCDLLVTTDSGPRHFAAAFGRPVVTLFGPTHIEWTETYYSAAVHLQKAVPCGPCQLRVCPLQHECMTELLPAEVYSAAEKLLSGHRELRLVG